MNSADEQGDNLERVSARIGAAILEFYQLKREVGQWEFHVEELRRYVIANVGIIAPASSDRVMRDLRRKGLLHYKVVSRSQSLYRIEEKPPDSWFFNGEDQGQLF